MSPPKDAKPKAKPSGSKKTNFKAKLSGSKKTTNLKGKPSGSKKTNFKAKPSGSKKTNLKAKSSSSKKTTNLKTKPGISKKATNLKAKSSSSKKKLKLKSNKSGYGQLATFKENSKSERGYESFDKLMSVGRISCPVEMGTLKRVIDGANKVTFEFALNGIEFDAWSSSKNNNWAATNRNLLKVGYKYVLEGQLYVSHKSVKYERSSNTDFTYSVCMAEVRRKEEDKDKDFTLSTVDLRGLKERVEKEQSFTETIDGLEIVSGNLRRYLGCTSCFAGLPKPAENGKFYCKKCESRRRSKKAVQRRVCLIIRDLCLKDKSGNILSGILCFQEGCELLLGKNLAQTLCTLNSDQDARDQFESIFGTIIKATIKHQKPNSSKTTPFNVFKLCLDNVVVTEEYKKKNKKAPVLSSVPLTEESSKCSCESDTYDEEDGDSENDENEQVVTSTTTFIEPDSDSIYSQDSNGVFDLKLTQDGYIGLALIVNIEFCNSVIPAERRGSNRDVENIVNMFSYLRVKVFRKAFSEMHKQEFLNTLDEFRNELLNGNYSCSFIVLMSHGSLFTVRLRGEKERVNVYTEILPKFSEQEFQQFAGKPKFFFFVTCQTYLSTALEGFSVDAALRYPNVLVCVPCGPGIVARRNPKQGSHFVQTLTKTFLQNCHNNHIEEMLKKVQTEMMNKPLIKIIKEANNKQRKVEVMNVPHYMSICFRNCFYFSKFT